MRNRDYHKNDPKNTWKLINSLTGHSSISKLVNEIEVDDKTFRDISGAFNKLFANIGPKLASKVTNMSIPVENVLNTLRQLNISNGAGLDKIPAKMLRIAADIIAPSLTYISNLSVSTGVFVDDWKDARVIPIYEEGR